MAFMFRNIFDVTDMMSRRENRVLATNGSSTDILHISDEGRFLRQKYRNQLPRVVALLCFSGPEGYNTNISTIWDR